MSNLDNLISKILRDCEQKAKQIVETAEEKASEVLKESAAGAEKEKELILEGAQAEASKQAEQIIVGKKLEIRDDHLNAKRQVIDKVFELALSKLNNMPKNEFWRFLSNNLLKLDLDGEEILTPAKYGFSAEEINEFLKKNKKKGNLVLYKGSRKIDGGFVLIKKGIENNNTFEALIDYYRDDLESDIIAKLF